MVSRFQHRGVSQTQFPDDPKRRINRLQTRSPPQTIYIPPRLIQSLCVTCGLCLLQKATPSTDAPCRWRAQPSIEQTRYHPKIRQSSRNSYEVQIANSPALAKVTGRYKVRIPCILAPGARMPVERVLTKRPRIAPSSPVFLSARSF